MPLLRSLPLAAAVVLLLAGCAGHAGAAPGATGSPSPSPSASRALPGTPRTGGVVRPGPVPTPPGGARTVHLAQHAGAAPGGTRIGPVWQLLHDAAGSPEVQILWTSGTSPACGAPTDVYVQETGAAVVIDLAGRPPAGGQACSALAVVSTTTVTLATPLGSRTLEEHRLGACPLPTPSSGMQPQVACPRVAGRIG